MTSYIYRFYNRDDSLLYVGITKDPTNRFVAHKQKPWWDEVADILIRPLASWEEASKQETVAIASEAPRYNLHPGFQVEPIKDRKPRRPKTHQPLPVEELEYLNSLSDTQSVIRARELYNAGWSMPSILQGLSVTPTTTWLLTQFAYLLPDETSGRKLPPIPENPTTQKLRTRKEEEAERMKPRLVSHEVKQLKELAKEAKRYRPTHHASHPTAVAASQYTQMLRDLSARGVRTQEMADAVGVNESNIRRRLK